MSEGRLGKEIDHGNKWRVSFHVKLMVHVKVDTCGVDMGGSGTEKQRAIDLAKEYVENDMDFGNAVLLECEEDMVENLGEFEVPLDEAESKVIDD